MDNTENIKGFFNSYENKANLGQNIFLNSFIILGFVIASLFIFPILSDSIFLEVCKSKFNELNNIMDPHIKLFEELEPKFKESNFRKIQKKRNTTNPKNLLKKLFPWIMGFSSLFICGGAYYIYNVNKIPGRIETGKSLAFECVIIILIMLSSFITEYFILTYVYTKYQYAPGISLLSILFDIFKSGLNNSRADISRRIDKEVVIDLGKLGKLDKLTELSKLPNINKLF